MKVGEVAVLIETFAPLQLQAEFDNSGLNVGHVESEVTGVLLCVDVTEQVLEEAIALKLNLVISHHPLLFHPMRQVTGRDFTQRIVEKALINGISLYAAHTNLDSATEGLSFRLGEVLGLTGMRVLAPHAPGIGTGYGVIGDLAGGSLPALDFLRKVKSVLRCGAIRYSPLCGEFVARIALSTGSGASFIGDAIDAGADMYLAADFKYNDFFTPDGRIVVADVGHFESEYCAIALLFDIITKKIATFAVHTSEYSINPVNYLV